MRHRRRAAHPLPHELVELHAARPLWAAALTEIPADLPAPYREALELANQAKFTQAELDAYEKVRDEIRQVLGSVQASFLAAAFEAIEADYGDLETYLRDGLGLGKAERAHLEARYLQR